MDHTQDQNKDQSIPVGQGAGIPPVDPVGTFQKEQGPISTEPLIRPSQEEHIINKELAEIGVGEVSQTPQLTQEDTQVGIRTSDRPIEHVTASAPVTFQSPLTPAEIVTAKKSRISDAIAWLAGTILRQIKRSRFKERKSLPKPI